MSYFWKTFEDETTVGTIGSEGGKIIKDEENTFGARVTLEGKGDVAPSSITIGIYGLMFHTDFFDSVEQAMLSFDQFKIRIDKLITHNLVGDHEKGEDWSKKQERLIAEIVSEI
ncbi:MAG: hypothetical protein ABJN95_03920 [Maribacter sp.]|uniref:hypothetical protein n=1 Tax=Maribacter sp. TaxID=1897614 RepID=UPI003297A7E4